ncbi:hypothetical protein EIP86_009051 [Pleurotus ostreatoroseus]|nr:hypothetical protein EIP86_009051 [Pleurotus ostreatoroseus]
MPLKPMTVKHFWQACIRTLDTRFVDSTALRISTTAELLELIALIKLVHPSLAPACHIRTLYIQGTPHPDTPRLDEFVVVQKSNLRLLRERLPALHTIALDCVAFLRPPTYVPAVEARNGRLRLERLVVDRVLAKVARDAYDRFCPQDLVYVLSPFARVTQVRVGLDIALSAGHLSGVGMHKLVESLSDADADAEAPGATFENSAAETMLARQRFIDGALETTCRVGLLSLHCWDKNTGKMWFDVLTVQTRLEWREISVSRW